MTDFEKEQFRKCYDVVHAAIGMLRDTMKELGSRDAMNEAAAFEQALFTFQRRSRAKHQIPYEEGK